MKAQTFLLSLFFFFSLATSLVGQRFESYNANLPYNKAIYLELGGNGLLYSFNYDMRLNRGRQDGIGFKIGVGGISVRANGENESGGVGYLAIPATCNYLIGKRRHALEMGVGATLFHLSASGTSNNNFVSGSGTALLPHANFGYRYQALNDGFTFRLALTPFIGAGPFAGISFGFNFK